MTQEEEIKAALTALNLTPKQAARLFRHDERTMRRWIAGDRGIPQGIAILLKLLLSGTITIADVGAASDKAFE